MHRDLLADMIARIGQTGFGPAVMAAYAGIGASMCSAFGLSDGAPRILFAQSAEAARSPFARIASLRYASRYWRRDTEMLYNLGRAHRAVLTVRRSARSIRDIDYRLECYGEGDVGERLSILRSGPVGLIVNAYRDKDDGPFAPDEIEWVEETAQLVIAAVGRHHELAVATRTGGAGQPGADEVATRLREMPGAGLSLREAQILAHAHLGASQAETAAELGLAVTSIATYRRRAYAKLGLRNPRQVRTLLDPAQGSSARG